MKRIGDNLKENTYKAMKKIAEGFFHWPQNELDPNDEKTRLEVQKSTMRLLFRLLFLLYAEGKGLLNIENKHYRGKYSFYQLKKEVAENKNGSIQSYYSYTSTSLWSRLKNLSDLINQGSEALNVPRDQFYVPAYKGSLFDPSRCSNLEKWTIADTNLADVIDLLARTKHDHKMVFIDYSMLEISELGNIYENLLGYKLKIAQEDMVVKGGGKKRKWITLEVFNKGKRNKKTFEDFNEFDRVHAGDLYLATDKGERKVTGTYYTPDYIVDYIVKNTVGPIIEDKWKEATKKGQSLLGSTLSVKVLDPAMGNGHFLVNIVEFLAEKVLEAVQKDLEKGLIEDDRKFTSEWAKRAVLSHCIYGVDKNDLAIELAKISLWLSTTSNDLIFLDHRLKQGNSLVGTHLKDLPWHPLTKNNDQKSVDTPGNLVRNLLDAIKELGSFDEEDVIDIKRKEELFENLIKSSEYDLLRTLLDLRTSIYFGNECDESQYSNYIKEACFNSANGWKERKKEEFVIKARKIAEEKKFFHWELEFPDVFFEDGKFKENSGFDVVIGNPPYVSIEKIDKKELDYIKSCYNSATYGRTDLYIVFIELAYFLSRVNGCFSMITPDKWLVSNYGAILRKLLLFNNQITHIWDLRGVNVFDDAANSPIVFIANKSSPSNNNIEFIVELPQTPDYLNYNVPQSIFQKVNNCKIKIGLTEKKWNLIKKIDAKSQRLKDFCYVSYGAQPGLLSKFVFYDKQDALQGAKKLGGEENLAKIIKPFIKGQNISRYEINYDGGLLLYLPEKLHRPAFPELFECEKIVISEIANHLKATYDDKGLYGNEKVVFVVSGWALENIAEKARKRRKIPELSEMTNHTKNYSLKYILSLINSRLMNFYFTTYIGDKLNVYPDDIRQLPIRQIYFTTSSKRRNKILMETKSLYEDFLKLNDDSKIINFIETRLCKSNDTEITRNDESDVLHDLLSYLSDQIIELNKEKNKEISRFLLWLEGKISAKIRTLTNRTKLKQYHNLNFTEILSILRKNKNKIHVTLSNEKFQDTIKKEVKKSSEIISGLKKKIETTDTLIDQIIYKLYDLTDEEIKIIE
ncbi:MAG: Eco57I restriction-modification methylase domain-containing protein [Candidatus Hermodarchaeota archaeon]